MSAARDSRAYAAPAALTASACAGLLASEAAHAQVCRALAKCLASAGFVWLAAASAAAGERPSSGGSKGGRAGSLRPHACWLLAAALLCFAGDLALLGASDAAFLAGLSAFLAGHVAYIAAFASAGARPGPTLRAATALAAPVEAVRRWLWPGVPPPMRLPVIAYLAVLTLMVAAAAALAAPHATAAPAAAPAAKWPLPAQWAPGQAVAAVAAAPPAARQAKRRRRRRAAAARLTGAVLFLLSDVAVAVDRFKGGSLANKAWGLPSYYAGQLLLASTAGAPV